MLDFRFFASTNKKLRTDNYELPTKIKKTCTEL